MFEEKKKKEVEEAKALEEKKKKELAETKKLMDDSVGEVIEEGKQHEQIPIQQLKADNFSLIAEGDEEDIFATKRFMTRKKGVEEPATEEKKEKASSGQEGNLEEAVQREHPGRAARSGSSAYQSLMENLRQDYERLKSYRELAGKYELTNEQKSAVHEITGRLEYAQEYAEKASETSDKYRPMSKAIENVASAGMRLLNDISGEYVRELRDDYESRKTH